MIEIPLTQGQVALIDDEDFEIVSRYKWCARWSPCTNSFYAMTNIRNAAVQGTTLRMHRLIMKAQQGEQIDHINHDTLDNRKAELRLCTQNQNQHNRSAQANNTSGYKGVFWHKASQKWQAQIQLNGKRKSLGCYAAPEAAHQAYCKAALELHGEFARVAWPTPPQPEA